jgi:predicted porin
MKKSLLAVAAMGAFASVAQAQSSVTVYGILDQSFSSLQQRNATGSGLVTNQTNAIIGGNGSETTSRIGFRGTEDLGGGVSAFFTIETAITPNSAQNFSTSGTANRQTFIGLSKKGLGQASVGTQYTPIHTAMAATSAGQQNNIVGDVLYPNASTTNQGAVVTNQADGGTFGYVVRANNSINLRSDNVAGFVGTAFYTQNNSTTNMSSPANGSVAGTYTGGTNNNTGYGLGVNYTWNKLLATANYQSFKAENPYGQISYVASASSTTTSVGSSTAGGVVAWGVSGASAAGTNTQDDQMYFAATYDFGVLKAYAGYLNRKVANVNDGNTYAKRSAQQIGVRSFITPKIEGWASVGSGRVQAYGASLPTANFTGYQLGSNYWLSKRTNLYAIYGATGTSNVSNNVANTTGQRSSNYSQYAIGARHTF